ncbi:MAG: ribonuclease E/G [Alphaproteobacteria bacterium]
MLIDASHPEETRVVIVSGNRLEEFDYETASKQQIKGNIYLAKVTRVEPSLQAAFVDYGGNRHGFLAFNEIHPDYYRIPVADREKLYGDDQDEPVEAIAPAANGHDDEAGADLHDDGDGGAQGAGVEVMGGDEDEDIERERRRLRMLRNYRIQEVIKRRQIMLVQVTKEERGNKGAALTTYLSLAGRYCVLMPNTARGGGVSRKISNPADRKRLRGILDELEIPDGMAVIVRTAGSERSRAEIKRDYEYLMRLWDQIRQTTLQSVSPALIHEEGNLIKRSIRDLYSRDIDEVIVDGEPSYRTAKDFMRMLMPSHASRVKRFKDEGVPLFQQHNVESQLDEIHSNTVRLKSGGYLVINPTEALVSIDVNSGRATRERHIEETALKTNLEAAQEVARQLRLRDLAGLIVIDFIDMDESRNNTAVERKLKEALRGDRARIQIGRISAFGLLEMSRQRLRPSIIEASSQVCPHCNGMGHIRSTESSALQVLRGIEEEGLSRRSAAVQIYVPNSIALYLLNQKRSAIMAAEQRYEFTVAIAIDDTLIAPDYQIERTVERSAEEIAALRGATAAARAQQHDDEDEEEPEDLDEEAAEAEDGEPARAEQDDGKGRSRRRGRRRRRPRRDEAEGTAEPAAMSESEFEPEAEAEAEPVGEEEPAEATAGEAETVGEDGQAAPRSRRGRRGGRRRRRRDEGDATADEMQAAEAAESGEPAAESEPMAAEAESELAEANAETVEDAVAEPEMAADAEPEAMNGYEAEAEPADEADEPIASPAEQQRAETEPEPESTETAPDDTVEPVQAEQAAARRGQPRRGWWQRLIEG